MVDDIKVQDGYGWLVILKIYDLVELAEPMVAISRDDAHSLSEFDPQEPFLIVGMDEGHNSIAIILEKGVDSDKTTLIALF